MAGLLSVLALGCFCYAIFVEDIAIKLQFLYLAFGVKCVQCLIMGDRYYKSLREEYNGSQNSNS